MKPDAATRAALHLGEREVQQFNLRKGAGCPRCNHTGYRGRTGIFEIMQIDSTVRELIANQSSESALRTAARRSGMHSLREDALDKAAAGITSLDEVLRVTTTDVVDAGSCPVCAQNVADDFSMCPWCGIDLRPNSCTECARHLEMGWKVCPTCGTPTDSQAPRDRNAKPVLLLADSDRAVRSAVAIMVGEDYEVVQAEDGRAALEAVHRTKPDAALISVDLPELDGYAVTRELRARPVTVDLPVVLMTDSEDVDTTEGVRAGADDHVAKPLDADVLLARLDSVRRRLAS